ncbi:unnamed protein product, partial [Amoebophrya sp. A120]
QLLRTLAISAPRDGLLQRALCRYLEIIFTHLDEEHDLCNADFGTKTSNDERDAILPGVYAMNQLCKLCMSMNLSMTELLSVVDDLNLVRAGLFLDAPFGENETKIGMNGPITNANEKKKKMKEQLLGMQQLQMMSNE